MNILHVIGSMDPKWGGTCQAIRSSMNSLQEQTGIREVVCLDDPNADFLRKDPFTVHALGRGKGPWCYSSKLSPWLDENLQYYDVVIINGLWLYLSFAVCKAFKRHKKQQKKNGTSINRNPKLFVMPHGMLDPYFQRAPNRRLKALRNWLYWKLIEAEVVSSADGLLFTCEMEKRLARVPFRPYKPKLEINIGFGIEAPPLFSERLCLVFYEKCQWDHNRPYLLFLSRIHPKKGVDILIKAYATVLKEISKCKNNLPALVIAGPGLENSYGKKVQELVAKNPLLQSNVFFPGMLSGDAKWGAFYGCEAFILPSHQENFGIAIVEALACKKPVLISNQINICEEIKTGGGGIIAEDTFDGTIQLLKNWISLDPEQKKEMQKCAYNVYKQHFEISQAANKFQQAISL
jgi:glycosyltransferase involved in cell wall biosynthesis